MLDDIPSATETALLKVVWLLIEQLTATGALNGPALASRIRTFQVSCATQVEREIMEACAVRAAMPLDIGANDR